MYAYIYIGVYTVTPFYTYFTEIAYLHRFYTDLHRYTN